MMRDQAVNGDRANMTSDFGIAGLMASLSDIESSINEAVFAMNGAQNPEQKANAERRIMALMECRRRLELQLAQARQRQLNMSSRTVRASGMQGRRLSAQPQSHQPGAPLHVELPVDQLCAGMHGVRCQLQFNCDIGFGLATLQTVPRPNCCARGMHIHCPGYAPRLMRRALPQINQACRCNTIDFTACT